MKWLRECLAEYARHPLPTFIGTAIIAASLVTAAMTFITRHPASEPAAPLAGSAQSATQPPPSTRAPRPSPAPPAPAAQPEAAAPAARTAGHRQPRAQHRTHPHPHPHGRNDHRHHPRHHTGH